MHKQEFLLSSILKASLEENSVQNLVLSLTDLSQHQNQWSNKESDDDAKTSKTLKKNNDPTSPVTQHTQCKPNGNLLAYHLEF